MRFKFGGILRIDYETKDFSRIAGTEGLATWDGLIKFEGGFLGSSPATGDLWFVKDGQARSIANIGPSISDFGWDPVSQTIYVPHLEQNKVKAAYSHAEYLSERVKMMQAWADFLDHARTKKKP